MNRRCSIFKSSSRDFLLFLFELFVQVFLLRLQLTEHVLLFALVTLQVFLLFLAGAQRGLFVILVCLKQFVLRVYFRLRALNSAHLFLTIIPLMNRQNLCEN